MTLTELRYLTALDKERHFGRAARRSFVSQPTLSVAVRKIEDELGVTVFERSRGEARITPIGRQIIDQACRVLGEVATLESIAEQGRDELKGALRLGVIYTVGPYLLPKLIPQLRADAPDMPLVLEENFATVLSQQLHNNELDAIVVALPFADSNLSTWPVYDESFVVAMPKDHAWTAKRQIPVNDLAVEDLLLLGPGHCFRDQVLSACTDCRDPESERLPRAGSSLETIRHMVASGLGITVLPESSTTAESPWLATRPFAGNAPGRRIVIAWRKHFPRPRAIAALRDAIVANSPDGVQPLHSVAADNVDDDFNPEAFLRPQQPATAQKSA